MKNNNNYNPWDYCGDHRDIKKLHSSFDWGLFFCELIFTLGVIGTFALCITK